ncbi:MAG: NADH-quinone oxidoreductase subunit H [Gemmatimonadetes bacterium]|nr:NADH-quinone oxidoreductase subunit H [Gemmatimonadota bacterium]
MSLAAVAGVLLVGGYVVAVLDRAVSDAVSGVAVRWRAAFGDPVREAALTLLSQRTTTERPDAEGWALAPALLTALAASALVVIPAGPGLDVADIPAGLVLFGAATALVTIAVFLHGWSANSPFPLVGAYRFIAVALSVEIPFFLVLIGTALPAESLAVGDVVRSQTGMWNVLRQPLGLPIYLVGALGVAFWGPLNLSDAEDLALGTLAEVSGLPRLLWQSGQASLLVALAAMGAAAFLGGWLGPWLPGWIWMTGKTGVLLAVLVAGRHLLARVRLERFVVFGWTVLIPLALVDVFVAGISLL